jgi:hypothetical protein
MFRYIPIRPYNILFLAFKPSADVQFKTISNWKDCNFFQITNLIKNKNINSSPGDVIGFGSLDELYRNVSGILVAVHNLEYNIDEYGAIPNVQELYVRP